MDDNWDTEQLWKLFENQNFKYFNIPTVKEMNAFHNLLTNEKKEQYATDFNDCWYKLDYWHRVHDIYSENKFVVPYSRSFGKQIKFYEIWDYYVAPEDVMMVEEILKVLRELLKDYHKKEY